MPVKFQDSRAQMFHIPAVWALFKIAGPFIQPEMGDAVATGTVPTGLMEKSRNDFPWFFTFPRGHMSASPLM
jgi:hypothetical protein